MFASEGATVIGADMNEKGMEETLAMIKDTGKFYMVNDIKVIYMKVSFCEGIGIIFDLFASLWG